MKKIKTIISEATQRLINAGLQESAEIEAVRLLCHCTKLSPSSILLHQNKTISKKNFEKFARCIKLRCKRIPIHYITKSAEFFSLNFKVNRKVFIPRPETETLVEFAIKLIKNRPWKVLDFGTGTGCIAIAIAKFCKRAKVYATDISEDAIKVAKSNARANEVDVKIIKGDGFLPLRKLKLYRYFDMIVSNPPYVSDWEFNYVDPEVLHEPREALYGGKFGEVFHAMLVSEAPEFLKPGGILAMEMGFRHENVVKDIFKNSKRFGKIGFLKDLLGIKRVVYARRQN
jgi:release factor glutamine methyltransferase